MILLKNKIELIEIVPHSESRCGKRQAFGKLIPVKMFQALGVFGLCQIHSFVDYIRSKMSKEYFDVLFKALVTAVLSTAALISIILTITGKRRKQGQRTEIDEV